MITLGGTMSCRTRLLNHQYILQDPETRRDALNHYLRTPQFTYENILREFWQQQQTQILQETQRKAAEQEAKEREMRMLAEQHRQIARPDGQGLQPRRY